MGDESPTEADAQKPEEEFSKKSFTPIVKVNTFIIFLEKTSSI